MADFTSNGTSGGNWSNPATWTAGSGCPAPGYDNVEIVSGDVINIDINLGDLSGMITITSGTLNTLAGKTVGVTPAGLLITNNAGTITVNGGNITTNDITGVVVLHYAGGTIDVNNGNIGTNFGIVTLNNENIGTNDNIGVVTTNIGTITTNIGTITTNNGTIDLNNNPGVVIANYANVTATGGTINQNDGVVYLANSSSSVIIQGATSSGTVQISPIGVLPLVTNVRDTLVYDGGTQMGTCVVPVAADVKLGVAVDTAGTGTLAAGGMLVI
jgi:hypothetical protein